MNGSFFDNNDANPNYKRIALVVGDCFLRDESCNNFPVQGKLVLIENHTRALSIDDRKEEYTVVYHSFKNDNFYVGRCLADDVEVIDEREGFESVLESFKAAFPKKGLLGKLFSHVPAEDLSKDYRSAREIRNLIPY